LSRYFSEHPKKKGTTQNKNKKGTSNKEKEIVGTLKINKKRYFSKHSSSTSTRLLSTFFKYQVFTRGGTNKEKEIETDEFGQ
jgi:hypothetical protein